MNNLKYRLLSFLHGFLCKDRSNLYYIQKSFLKAICSQKNTIRVTPVGTGSTSIGILYALGQCLFHPGYKFLFTYTNRYHHIGRVLQIHSQLGWFFERFLPIKFKSNTKIEFKNGSSISTLSLFSNKHAELDCVGFYDCIFNDDCMMVSEEIAHQFYNDLKKWSNQIVMIISPYDKKHPAYLIFENICRNYPKNNWKIKTVSQKEI